MSSDERVLRPIDITKISGKIQSERKAFLDKVEKATGQTLTFTVDVSQAIGDISVTEAMQGVIDFFIEKVHEK